MQVYELAFEHCPKSYLSSVLLLCCVLFVHVLRALHSDLTVQLRVPRQQGDYSEASAGDAGPPEYRRARYEHFCLPMFLYLFLFFFFLARDELFCDWTRFLVHCRLREAAAGARPAAPGQLPSKNRCVYA